MIRTSVPFCAVLCTKVVHTHEQFLKMSVGLGLDLVFVHLFRFSILCFWTGWFSLGYFVLGCLILLCYV